MIRRKVDELVFPDGQRVAVWAGHASRSERPMRFVLCADIPMPWAERFFQGFIGAGPVLEDGSHGIYPHDVTRFISLWEAGKWSMRVSDARVK